MSIVLASIPSPGVDVIEIGPLTIHIYGILIGLGVVVALVVTTRRYEHRAGPGTAAIAERASMWAIGIGFLGARIGYVVTHTARFEGRPWAVLYIWEGGLALFGGLTAGALAAIWSLRRQRGDIGAYADGVAIGIPLAQAIGRWGNYFNQELFGTPSTLPWALEIDPANRPAGYAGFETFHPTFLYESLWNLLIVVPVLLVVERRWRPVRGNLFPLYIALYGVGRFLTELLRTDTTFRVLGLSRNGWISVAAVIGGIALFVIRERRARATDPPAESDETGSVPSETEQAT